MVTAQRDHLFISYATEDSAFAAWLTLRLSVEGYRVWCDQIKLLGGESYPTDIDAAIKQKTFRLLALISQHSLTKANPLKERTLALNLARERQEEFLIPLNLDGTPPTKLDWMLSDISWIPFNQGWADGLTRLLKKLRSIEAPRPLADGPRLVADWVANQYGVDDRSERLWTNVLDITELPDKLLRVSVASRSLVADFAEWPCVRENDRVYWAFEIPEAVANNRAARISPVSWRQNTPRGKMDLQKVAVQILRQYLRSACLQRGLKTSEDHRDLYFPPGLLKGNRLLFQGYTGKRTWTLAVGERTFRTAKGPVTNRYHLAPVLSPNLYLFDAPVILLRLRLYVTDANGKPLSDAARLRRRKAICKHWWNHEWLNRLLAVAGWLTNEEATNLARTDACRIVLASYPRTVSVPVGIDENALEPWTAEEPDELADEDPDESTAADGES